jgi:hypothetical protein
MVRVAGQPWWQQTWVSIAGPLVVLGGIAALANAVSDDDSAGVATTDTEVTVDSLATTSTTDSSVPTVSVAPTTVPGVTLPATTIAVTVPGVIETKLPATTTVETTTTVVAETTTTVPPPQNGAVGSTLTADAGSTTVSLSLLQFVDPAPSGGDELSSPFEGNRWVAALVMITNTGTGVYDDLPSGIANIVDGNGQEWQQAEFGGTSLGPAMDYVRLEPTDSRVGWMTFELPQAAAPATLSIDHGSRATWNLLSGSAVSAPPPTFSAADGGLGTPVAVTSEETELQVAVLRVVDPTTADEVPRPGWHHVAIELELTNVGTVLYDAPPDEGGFVIDSAGFEYPAAFDTVTSSGSPFPFPLDLDAGETARGIIVFEVADGAQLVRLQFSPDYGFGDNWLDFRLV